MKKEILLAFILVICSGLYGQKRTGKYVTELLLYTDQIIEYAWNSEKAEWFQKNRIKYDYSFHTGETRTVTNSEYYTGTPISRVIYSYTAEFVLQESVFQKWISGNWANTRRDLWFSNDEGLAVEAIIQTWRDNSWINSIRHTDYHYDNKRLLKYTYQTWTNGQWIDTFNDLWNYDEIGNLVLREQIRVND